MNGRRLLEWRESRGLSQRDAAKVLEVSARTLQLAEGTPEGPLGPKLRRRLAARLSQELANEAGDGRRSGAEPAESVVVPADLVEALERADTAQELLDFEKRVALESARNKLELRLAAFLIDACREMRQTLAARDLEQGQVQIGQLEIMTLDEAADLAAVRESKIPKGLSPGEAPPPPTASAVLPPPKGATS
jgi:hypothetical protein